MRLLGPSILILVLVPASVLAAPSSPATIKPWARGVSPARQSRAKQAFQQGNKLMQQGHCAAALKHYARAVRDWDHPSIQYNRVICQVRLGRLEAGYRSIERALRYGRAPLGKRYPTAVSYRALLRRTLARLEVSCNEPNARVSIDGHSLFTAPGRAARYLAPGSYLVVARKSGYLTVTQRVVLRAGQPHKVTLSLVTLRSQVRMKRRFRRYLPWVILGSGLALVAAGIPLTLQSAYDRRAYDSEIAKSCSVLPAGGCETSALPSRAVMLDRRARSTQAAGIALYTLGGLTAAAGAVLAILNRPRRVDSPSSNAPLRALLPTPVVTPVSVGVQWNLRF